MLLAFFHWMHSLWRQSWNLWSCIWWLNGWIVEMKKLADLLKIIICHELLNSIISSVWITGPVISYARKRIYSYKNVNTEVLFCVWEESLSNILSCSACSANFWCAYNYITVRFSNYIFCVTFCPQIALKYINLLSIFRNIKCDIGVLCNVIFYYQYISILSIYSIL